MGEMMRNEMERRSGSMFKSLRDFFGDAVVRYRVFVDQAVGRENPLRRFRRKVRGDRVDTLLQRGRREIAIKRDVFDFIDRGLGLGHAERSCLERRRGIAAGTCCVLEPGEPLLRGCRYDAAIAQYRGRAVMTDAIQGEQIERQIFDVFAERRDRIEKGRVSPRMTEARCQLAFGIALPTMPTVSAIAKHKQIDSPFRLRW